MKISLSQLIELYNNRQYEEVEQSSRRFLEAEPEHAYGWHLAAANAMQMGRLEVALERVAKAVVLLPGEVSFLNTQGSIYRQLGQLQQACDSYQKAATLDSANTDTLYNLANLYRDMGDSAKAIELYGKVLELDSRFHAARLNRANLYRHIGDASSAESELHSLMTMGGGTVQALFGLGQAILDQGRYAEAEGCFRQVLQHTPDDMAAVFALGNVLWSQGRITEAESCHRQCVGQMPGFYQAWNNLGNDLRDQGLQLEALDCYYKAIELHPEYMQAHSNLLLELNAVLENGGRLLQEHLRWDRQHAGALLQPRSFHNDRSPDKVLKIGYVSSDFCHHSVAFFIEGILRHHDAERFHITCYSNLLKPDEKTDTIRSLADCWREIGCLSDDSVAALICEDGIDILVDLSGHTSHHRLLVFARKPAPIQVTYLGYPATTGMQAMDYRISDTIADPAASDAFHRENVIRLPRCFIAYSPYEYAPEVSALPADSAGFIRFVSFNHRLKIGPDVIKLWSRVLHAVPNSRLMVKHFSFIDDVIRKHFLDLFSQQGISPERIEAFAWAKSPEEHLSYYHRVDVALDSFPYNGTTTTCESLWMGVPVVTLAGGLHAGRVGSSLMRSVGLADLVACDEDAYVEIARKLAEQRSKLREIRSTLRRDMLLSELCDSVSLVRALESEYRKMWQHWLDAEDGHKENRAKN